MAHYFVYSSHTTREEAESALEQYLADGRISEYDQPYIAKRVTDKWEHRTVYCIMFPG